VVSISSKEPAKTDVLKDQHKEIVSVSAIQELLLTEDVLLHAQVDSLLLMETV